MNKKELKPIANIVGVAPLGDPHFGENTTDSPKAYSNSNTKRQTLTSNIAITLIALVITIIVMLILVGVSVSIAINGGLFSTAKKATAETQYQEDREMLLSAVIGAINNNAEVDYEELDANLPEGFTVSEGLYTSKAGNKFCVNQSGNILTPPEVTVDGKTVALTPKNVATYLGKVVTNYKKSDTETETITIGEKQYTVSTKYRLYYVDFDNKYKDGEGTIYLKADYISGTGTTNLPTSEKITDSSNIPDNIKIKNLNPELYKNGTPPDANNENMKAVAWLTDTTNWKDLIKEETLDEIKVEDINYVVGAPSLEIMMDSYNTHYGLTEKEKLSYKFPYDNNRFGYAVKPSRLKGLSDFGFQTESNCPKVDGEFYLYNPNFASVANAYYWFASPSAHDSISVLYFDPYGNGYIDCDDSHGESCFCPVVSLKPSANMILE